MVFRACGNPAIWASNYEILVFIAYAQPQINAHDDVSCAAGLEA